MGYKENDACLKKVGRFEPIFVLRGQDKTAPLIIKAWVVINFFCGCNWEKLKHTWSWTKIMKKWPTRKWPD